MKNPMKNPIISRHAPNGHIAVAAIGGVCEGCSFKYDSLCPNVLGTFACCSAKRKDGQTVIFVKTPTGGK